MPKRRSAKAQRMPVRSWLGSALGFRTVRLFTALSVHRTYRPRLCGQRSGVFLTALRPLAYPPAVALGGSRNEHDGGGGGTLPASDHGAGPTVTGPSPASGALTARATANALNAAILAEGSAERAVKEKAYLKSSLKHHGTPVPVTRKLVRSLLRSRRDLNRERLVAIAEELWAIQVHEARAAAVMVLAARTELLLASDMRLLTRWLREARTWALVDEIAPRVAGPLLARYPELEATIDQWATDEDFWLRRAALLSYLEPLRRGEDVFERFAQLADRMLDEREFFVRKAIGWALRESGKRAPSEVHAWLRPRLARTSGVTLREAIKYLTPEQAAELTRLASSSRRK